MKIYAIGYRRSTGEDGIEKTSYLIYTCKFFSTTQYIDEEIYFYLKRVFNIAGKNNKHLEGMYYSDI